MSGKMKAGVLTIREGITDEDIVNLLVNRLTPENFLLGSRERGRHKRLIMLFPDHPWLNESSPDWRWYWIVNYIRYSGEGYGVRKTEQEQTSAVYLSGIYIRHWGGNWQLHDTATFDFSTFKPEK